MSFKYWGQACRAIMGEIVGSAQFLCAWGFLNDPERRKTVEFTLTLRPHSDHGLPIVSAIDAWIHSGSYTVVSSSSLRDCSMIMVKKSGGWIIVKNRHGVCDVNTQKPKKQWTYISRV